MSLKGIDVAWARPSVTEIKATGATWVARYFSTDPTKDLLPGEVTAYTAASLAIVTVWESSAGRALQGRQAGVQDAQSAIHERTVCGLPDSPIHFAVDTDTDWASVQAYFDGVCAVLPKDQVGVYGGFKVAEGAHAYGLKYIWQTTAWSGGQWSQWATIKQVGGTVLNGGADVDFAEVPDFGQYPRPETDMPLTPADLDAVQARVKAVLQDPNVRAMWQEDTAWWLKHGLEGTFPPGLSAAAANALANLHSLVPILQAEPVPVTPPAV